MACPGNRRLSTYCIHDKVVVSTEVTNTNETLSLSSGSYSELNSEYVKSINCPNERKNKKKAHLVEMSENTRE